MNRTKQIKSRFALLTTENKVLFILSCLERVHKLYELFEKEVQEDNTSYSDRFKGGSTTLSTFITTVLASYKTLQTPQIDELYESIKILAPEEDEYSSYQAAIAVNIVLIALNGLTLLKGEDIAAPTDYVLDILNNLKSETFFIENPDSDDEACEQYLDQCYEQEYLLQEQVLEQLESDQINIEHLMDYSKRHLL